MQRIFPEPGDIGDSAREYASYPRPDPGERPWVLANMIASADGAASVEGRSGGLGGPVDHEVFIGLRALSDVVMAGAQTVRVERYGPPRLADELQAQRLERGQPPLPRLAVVSRSLDLDLEAPLFATDPPPYVVTSAAAPPDRRKLVDDVAEVVEAGDDQVDLAAALAQLHDRGARVLLCEGGPFLLAQLVAGGLLDELCLTLAPLLVGGDSSRLLHHMDFGAPRALDLDRALHADGMLFLRYLVS